jgi:predicted nucleotidyltransferase
MPCIAHLLNCEDWFQTLVLLVATRLICAIPFIVMNTHETAHIMANRLRKGIHAERVWLFGSQARGNARVDSDIDLLAVIPASSVSRYQRAVAARRQLADFNVPMDIVVLTREEWEKELKAPCSLASTVTREGIVL